MTQAAAPASGPAGGTSGFRAAVNEARGARGGRGAAGCSRLRGRGLPRRARHSFPLNRAPGPAPPPRPARSALGAPGTAPGVGAGAGAKESGERGLGRPLYPCAVPQTLTESSTPCGVGIAMPT